MRTDGSLRVLNLAGTGRFFFNSYFCSFFFPQKPGIASSPVVIYLKNGNQWVSTKSNTRLGNTGDNMAANLLWGGGGGAPPKTPPFFFFFFSPAFFFPKKK